MGRRGPSTALCETAARRNPVSFRLGAIDPEARRPQTPIMRRGWALAFLIVAGCIPRSEPRPQPRPAPAEPQRPSISDSGTRQCLADLVREEVRFEVLPDRRFPGGCSALGAVQLTDIGTPVTNLGAMTCPLARQLARWTREAVQPAASRFLGSPVRRIETFGTYSCRGVNGDPNARLSEHAFANAVDVSAFVLADGRRITVEADWNGRDQAARTFLRAIHEAGCRRFAIGLGPDANRFHYNHMHFDMGRGPYCR